MSMLKLVKRIPFPEWCVTQQPPPPLQTRKMVKMKRNPNFYIKEHIERICKPLGVRAVFKSRGTLRQTLKTARPAMKKKDVIYELDCNMRYIGEKPTKEISRTAVRREEWHCSPCARLLHESSTILAKTN